VISVEEAQEVIAVAEAQTEAKALFCMEALMYRCHPLTRKLVQLVNEKVVGDIKLITATYTASIEKKANPKEGGAIRNLGCYPVSLVRLLAGEPTEILGTGRVSETSGNDNQASVILKFANNVMAVVSTADDVEMTWKFNILGTEGSIDVISNPWKPEQGDNKIIITSHDSHEQSELIVSTDHPLYAYQIDVVGNYHLGNYPVDEMRISLADSLGNVRVVEEWRSQVIPHGLSLTLQSRENYKPLLMGGYFSASDAAERKTLVVAADEKLGDESDLQSRNVMGFGGGVA
jgi:predicted dehydrogenase